MLMDKKGIEYEEIDNESIYMPIAEKYNIMSMPFAEIDDSIYTTKGLQKYIMEAE